MRLSGLITGIGILFSVIACNNMGDKAGKMAEKAEKSLAETYAATEEALERTKEKIDRKLDKINPGYDMDKPDTENNRNRFFDHLKYKPGKDVKEIYSFGDFLSIDYKVMMSFKADQTTIDTILARKGLKLSTEEHDGRLRFDNYISWWNEKEIDKLKPYKKGQEGQYWEYLWYDKQTKKAWYLEYNM